MTADTVLNWIVAGAIVNVIILYAWSKRNP